MFRYMVPYRPLDGSSIPAGFRPILRYRPESFGYLAAFPNGRVSMLDSAAEPLLARGASPEECRSHEIRSLAVATDFHFSAPLMAWLEITRRCNLRCPHCFVEGGTARGGELSTERILSLLDEWAEMGVFSVVITGGEPTIHPDFLTIVEHAHALGFTISIASNGMALTEKVVESIPRDDVIISVSIDGIHGQGVAKAETDFEFVTRRLLQLKHAGFNTSVMTTTTSQNSRDLSTIINWAVDHDVSLRSVPFVPMGRGALFRELMNTSADVELAANFWLAEEKWERIKDQRLGLCSGKVFNFLLTMVFATRRCMSGRGVCYVNSAGDVFPCSTCSGRKVLGAGNVQLNSFQEIWESEDWQIRQITWKDFESTCDGCPVSDDRYFCTGRCPGSSSVLTDTLSGCGTTRFQRDSILRREALFREQIRDEPRVYVGGQIPGVEGEEE
jgi:radical SAM protein with 4Fe4S-binding SPASM domain